MLFLLDICKHLSNSPVISISFASILIYFVLLRRKSWADFCSLPWMVGPYKSVFRLRDAPHSLYQIRASGVGRKIESTVNTQRSFSFSTRPLTANSQQSTVNSHRKQMLAQLSRLVQGLEQCPVLEWVRKQRICSSFYSELT